MEKIRITDDDVARVETSSAFSTPQPTPPVKLLPDSPTLSAPWFMISGGAAAAVILALVLIFSLSRGGRGGEPTMDEWKDAERRQVNSELAASSKVKPFIESIHPFVTFTGAAIKSLSVTTVDGSERVGIGGVNIAEIAFVVTYHWEGPVEKNGYTEVLYVWDNQANRLKTSRYLESNAAVNLDNIDWFTVGVELAPLLFGGN